MKIPSIALILLVNTSVLYVTVSGLKCLNCHTTDDVDSPKSACYQGTDQTLETCTFMSICAVVKGEVDTVPKDNPSASPTRKVAALRRCVPSLAAIGIRGCTTNADPYMHFANDAQNEYLFSNFDGSICLCQTDGCTGP